MRRAKSWRPISLLAATVACILVLGACSAGSLGSSDKSGGTTIRVRVDNSEGSLKPTQAVAEAFHAKNPDITVDVETRPQGAEGDNVVKTRLSTGEMTEVFFYNSGSLFQALNPQKNLVPLTGEPWASQLEDIFKPTVSVGSELYGAPITGSTAGGILYNKKVYEKLGLQVPKTWSEFMANNAKIKAAGIDPVIQTYQDTWTSQLFVLADFHNVAAADPSWAEKYTNGQGEVRPGAGDQGIPAPRRGPQGRVPEQGLPVDEVREGRERTRRGQGRTLPDSQRRGRQPGGVRP
jgi:raffinose/stachyose/melibiose transport system substrate-binding protein